MVMLRALARVVICILLLAGALPALAAEGRVPIFAPGPIVADGKYIVTRDIVAVPGGVVIDVLAPNVDIDLNGFTLTQPFALPVINVGGVPTHLTIRNGSLALGTFGIQASIAGGQIVVEDVKIQSPSTVGIHVLDIENIAIRRVMLQDVGGPGILIDGLGVHTATIESCVIRDVGGDGIALLGGGGTIAVLNNRIEATNIAGLGPGGASIYLAPVLGSLVSENTITASAAQGIFLRGTKGNKLFDNVVQGSNSHGIHLDAGAIDTLVLNNVASGNGFGLPGGHGLFVEGDRNLIERNTLNGNSGYGLFLTLGSAANTFGRNMARGNAGPAGCPLLFPPNSCDAGVGNSTFGDNLIPGPPIF
jgi:parallel beta-helix repeat protein